MRIYVAGASLELARVKRVMATLEKAGHTITFDWTRSVAEHGSIPASFSYQNEAAEEDCSGLEMAEVALFLHPGPGVFTTGFWFELGYQRGLVDGDISAAGFTERDTLVSFETEESRQQPAACIFTSLIALEEHLLDDEILAKLESLVPF